MGDEAPHDETSPLVGDVGSGPKGADADAAGGGVDSRDREAAFADDVLDTLHLAGPIFVSSVSWVGVSARPGREDFGEHVDSFFTSVPCKLHISHAACVPRRR